tara:strand:- start:267 stop:446 length:180 start_codon:yes stop_codon:yes gene_type:complete
MFLIKDGSATRSKLPMAVLLNWFTAVFALVIRYLADQNVFPSYTKTLDTSGDLLLGEKF